MPDTRGNTEQRIGDIKNYFDEVAWTPQQDGTWTDTVLEVSPTRLNDAYTFREHTRNRRSMRDRGDLFLDAGCGARPYTVYASGFRRHVCLDFSLSGLKGARGSLGKRGWYVLGDLRAMPFKDGVFDGFCSPYAIHHIAGMENQRRAFGELHRILAPGSSGVVIYDNPNHLGIRARRWINRHPGVKKLLASREGKAPGPSDAGETGRVMEAMKAREALLHYEPLPASVLAESVPDRESFRVTTHSLITEPAKKKRFRDTPLWRLLTRAMLACESGGGGVLWPVAAVWCIIVTKRSRAPR
jgi:ubiquinone/menaquinone biosynthesis C-methylase UbiE